MSNVKKNAVMRLLTVFVLTMICSMLLAGSAMAEEKGIFPGGKKDYNLLLIGSDRRDTSWNGNSDVMMLMTLRSEAQEIHLTSFMRDLYAEIPGHGVHKLNYAFAVSGAEKLIETLENNYALHIDNYAVVDFESMEDVVDIVGGVEINVTEEECKVLNNYITSLHKDGNEVLTPGLQRLNGAQAVAYMRIRYVGNNDYQRTQRQRDVLQSIFGEIKNLSSEELGKLAEEVIPSIKHNIGALDLLTLMADIPEVVKYHVAESRIPYDDLYHSSGEMLVPDFGATIARLHSELGIE